MVKITKLYFGCPTIGREAKDLEDAELAHEILHVAMLIVTYRNPPPVDYVNPELPLKIFRIDALQTDCGLEKLCEEALNPNRGLLLGHIIARHYNRCDGMGGGIPNYGLEQLAYKIFQEFDTGFFTEPFRRAFGVVLGGKSPNNTLKAMPFQLG